MEIAKGTRVVITDGPGGKVTARGTYEGTVDLYGAVDPKTGEMVVDEQPFSIAGLSPVDPEALRGQPKIRLEDGTVVYECQCWWGREEGEEVG